MAVRKKMTRCMTNGCSERPEVGEKRGADPSMGSDAGISSKKSKFFEDIEKARKAEAPSGVSIGRWIDLCFPGNPSDAGAGTEPVPVPVPVPVWPDGYALVPDPDPFRGRKPILVDDEAFPEDSMCPVCWEVPFDAVQFPYCPHGLCGACMKRIVGTAKSVLCPLCRKRQTLTFWRKKNGGGFPIDLELRAKVDELWVFCPRASEGSSGEKEGPKCDAAFPLGKLRDHLRVCPHSTVRCNAAEGEEWGEKCNHVGLLKDLADHRRNDCDFIRRKCSRCDCGVTPRRMKLHLERHCDRKSPCPQCGRSVLERSTERHLRDECDFKLPCPECDLDVPKRSMEHHMFRECSERQCLCPNRGCEWSGKIYDVDDHRETCEFADIECPLSECTWRGSPLDLNVHLDHPAARSNHGELLLRLWERRGMVDHHVSNRNGQIKRKEHRLLTSEFLHEPGDFFCTYSASANHHAFRQRMRDLEHSGSSIETFPKGTPLPRDRPKDPILLGVRSGNGCSVRLSDATYGLRVWRSGDWVSLELTTVKPTSVPPMYGLYSIDLPDFSVNLVPGGFPLNYQKGFQMCYASGGIKVDRVGWERFVPWEEWEEMRKSPASATPMEGLWKEGDSLVFDFYR